MLYATIYIYIYIYVCMYVYRSTRTSRARARMATFWAGRPWRSWRGTCATGRGPSHTITSTDEYIRPTTTDMMSCCSSETV